MSTTKQQSILIVRLSALGDVAMTLPAIYSLASQYPQLQINMLTRPFFAGLFINAPANINVIGIDLKKEYKGLRGTIRLLKRLSALNPDYVADLHNVLRSWIIGCFFRIKGKRTAMVSKGRSGRRKALRECSRQPNFVDRYADVFARLGFPVRLTFRSIFSAGVPVTPVTVTHPAVGIAPFARYYNKTYPLDLMRKVVNGLTAQGIHVYLFGGRGKEAELLDSWQSADGMCLSLAGRYPLADELALMSLMDVMVSMDSANQHMASITGVPVASIWGSTAPVCGFLGYRQESSDAICLDLPCQPCSVAGGPECPLGHLDCMNKISPDMIIEKIKSIIARNR